MDHAEVMRILLEERERRTLKREVARLNLAEIVAELENRQFNSSGEEEVLRDRLLRVLMREVEPENDLIPWYDWDVTDFASEEHRVHVEQDQVNEEEMSEADESNAKQVRESRPWRTEKGAPRKSPQREKKSSLSGSDDENCIRPLVVTADVHRSDLGTQMVPTSTTTVITTSQAESGGVATVPTAGSRQTTTGTSSASKRPEPTLPPEILDYLMQNPAQWEYQCAQLIRSTRASTNRDQGRPGIRTPRRPVSQKEEWHTPAENLESLRWLEARESESDGSERLSRHERVAYENIRLTLGRRRVDQDVRKARKVNEEVRRRLPRSINELKNELSSSSERERNKRSLSRERGRG